MKSLKQYIAESKIFPTMFRNNRAFGNNVIDAEKVLQHEIFELRNGDILMTCVDRYFDGTEYGKELTRVADELENEDFMDNETEQKEFVKNLLGAVSWFTGINIKYVLWLASPQSVIDNYGGSDDNIEEYPTSAAVLSDLNNGYDDGDGMLFGYEEKPEPIN